MKQLLLMRHAKSDWTSPAATDFERPLNSRGERDVPRMATLLKACDMVPQCLLTSPALRARQTAEGVGAVLGIKPTFNPDLYLASLETLVGTLEKQPTELESIMLVGHNPGAATDSRISAHRFCRGSLDRHRQTWRRTPVVRQS